MVLDFNSLPAAVSNIQERLECIGQSIGKLANNQEAKSEWFNVTELCNYLPDKPKDKTVHKWVHYQKIPYYKGSKALRFFKPEIDEWLKEGKVETIQNLLKELNVSGALPVKRRVYA